MSLFTCRRFTVDCGCDLRSGREPAEVPTKVDLHVHGITPSPIKKSSLSELFGKSIANFVFRRAIERFTNLFAEQSHYHHPPTSRTTGSKFGFQQITPFPKSTQSRPEFPFPI